MIELSTGLIVNVFFFYTAATNMRRSRVPIIKHTKPEKDAQFFFLTKYILGMQEKSSKNFSNR